MTSRPRYGILSAMFWYVMLMLLSPLYLISGLVFRTEQARLVLALYQQVLILQRQLGKRPSLVPIERLALVLSSLLPGAEKLRETLLVVKPETLVGWHRAIVRRHWRLLSRRKPGRPPEITPETEQLVLRIARENRWMGYGKVAGEMRKLGFVRFGRTSVARILSRHGLTPERPVEPRDRRQEVVSAHGTPQASAPRPLSSGQTGSSSEQQQTIDAEPSHARARREGPGHGLSHTRQDRGQGIPVVSRRHVLRLAQR